MIAIVVPPPHHHYSIIIHVDIFHNGNPRSMWAVLCWHVHTRVFGGINTQWPIVSGFAPNIWAHLMVDVGSLDQISCQVPTYTTLHHTTTRVYHTTTGIPNRNQPRSALDSTRFNPSPTIKYDSNRCTRYIYNFVWTSSTRAILTTPCGAYYATRVDKNGPVCIT